MNRASTQTAPRWGFALLLRLHFYAGLLVGPFIFVAALSGAVFALTPQIESWLYHTELTTEAPGPAQPLAEQIRVARTFIGDEATLAAVRPAPSEGETTRVMFTVPNLQPYEHQAVFIDPATLAVRGSLVVYGTSGTLPFRIWIDYVHRHLHLGDIGRYYSELAASWLWLVALGGLVLWWQGRKGSRRSDSPRQRLRRWHSTLGMGILLALLFFSVTGLTWSKWEAPFTPLLADRPRHAVILSSRGGVGFEPGGELAHLNHLEPGLTTVLEFIGITRIHRIAVENQEAGGDLLADSVANAERQVTDLVGSLLTEVQETPDAAMA